MNKILELPKTVDLTPLKYSKSQEIALKWTIKNFKIIHEKENEYDDFALAVYKIDKDNNEYHIGYIKKNEYEFTEKANKLYEEYQNRLFELTCELGHEESYAYEIAQSEYFIQNGWGEKEPKEIYSLDELNNLLKNQHQYKILTARPLGYDWYLYLELKDNIQEAA